MEMKNNEYEIDMCHGPLLSKMLLFAIPLILSGILQLLFNAADIIVVGRYAGSTSLAAVGSTSVLINLLTNVFIGLSIGVNVLIAQYYGAGEDNAVSDTVHTALLLSVLSGIFLSLLGIFLVKPLLILMGTPDNVLTQATCYLKIYFLGMPAMMLYNFGASILRAIGDTKRPLYFLSIAGIVNIGLNLYFVIILKMDVAGVATATTISQYISAFLVVRCLAHSKASYQFKWSKLKLHKNQILRIIRIGLPAGMQGAIFSISNVLIQSSVNSFGSIAMAGNTAASNIEGFVYTSMNALYQTTLSFTSQNMGAKKFERIDRILGLALILVSIIGGSLGFLVVYFGPQLLSIYSSDTKVIAFGLDRMHIICLSYFLCGIMEIFVGSIRGLGYSIMPMIVSLLGACLFRVIWIFTIFAAYHSLWVLYISYPVSWIITALTHFVCFLILKKRLQHI